MYHGAMTKTEAGETDVAYQTDGEEAGGAADSGHAAVHPIGVVAKQTGITLHVLRAWERRYGVVEPVRTPGGQRLYSDADIARLRLLRQVTEAGRNISQVAALPQAELERVAAQDARDGEVAKPESAAAGYRARCVAAAERLDGDAVHAVLMRAVVSLRPAEFLDDVLMPLLREVGELWHGGSIGPAHEHVVSVAARRVVAWLLEAYEAPANAPLALVTTVAGEQHEFGALMVSVVALDEGWRVTHLGTSLPASEIIRAARAVKPSLVALSVVNTAAPAGLDDVVGEVTSVRAALPPTVPLVVGGAGAVVRRAALEAAGATVIDDGPGLRRMLRLRRQLVRGGAY
jgi:MerR family transcriptional regulator, light-induced transcriptional regulator